MCLNDFQVFLNIKLIMSKFLAQKEKETRHLIRYKHRYLVLQFKSVEKEFMTPAADGCP